MFNLFTPCEIHRYIRSDVRRAFNGYFRIMLPSDMLDNRKSQPGSARFFASAFINAVEALKNPLFILI